MAHRSPTSSTTQIRPWSRLGSAQIEQGSIVSRLPHTEQARIARAASARALPSGSIRVSRFFRRWSAARRAERGPRPGSRPSNWISRSISGPFIAGAKTKSRVTCSKLEARRQGHAAGDAAHLLLHRLLDLGPRVVGRGHDQVLDHALVGRHEQRGVDLDLARLVLAVDRHLDQTGAGAADDLQALEHGLQLLHLLLHGLGLLHQAAQILEFVEHQNSLSGMSSSAGY